jgi:hypothetical protein
MKIPRIANHLNLISQYASLTILRFIFYTSEYINLN